MNPYWSRETPVSTRVLLRSGAQGEDGQVTTGASKDCRPALEAGKVMHESPLQLPGEHGPAHLGFGLPASGTATERVSIECGQSAG